MIFFQKKLIKNKLVLVILTFLEKISHVFHYVKMNVLNAQDSDQSNTFMFLLHNDTIFNPRKIEYSIIKIE